MNVEELQLQVTAFAAERQWQKFHDPKNLAMALASEVGELCATLRWIPSGEADEAVREPRLRVQIEDEIGDVGNLLLLLCARMEIDLSDVVRRKLNMVAQKYPVGEQGTAPNPTG